MALFNSSEFDDLNATTVEASSGPSLESITEKLFAICDWERSSSTDMPELLCAKLFAAPLAEDEEAKRTCLAMHRPYPTCPTGGTLLHLLCDVPASTGGQQASQYYQSTSCRIVGFERLLCTVKRSDKIAHPHHPFPTLLACLASYLPSPFTLPLSTPQWWTFS